MRIVFSLKFFPVPRGGFLPARTLPAPRGHYPSWSSTANVREDTLNEFVAKPVNYGRQESAKARAIAVFTRVSAGSTLSGNTSTI